MRAQEPQQIELQPGQRERAAQQDRPPGTGFDAQERVGDQPEVRPGLRRDGRAPGKGGRDVDARQAVQRGGQPGGDEGRVAGSAGEVDPDVHAEHLGGRALFGRGRHACDCGS
ncbi:hypothetical protein ILP97_05415 [Amycolatopsis sp. H6(2020)]|nr:hypothetical protein [Amycolatopsis sp. H6(2020)]